MLKQVLAGHSCGGHRCINVDADGLMGIIEDAMERNLIHRGLTYYDPHPAALRRPSKLMAGLTDVVGYGSAVEDAAQGFVVWASVDDFFIIGCRMLSEARGSRL